LPSPLPFSKLGVEPPRKFVCPGPRDCFVRLRRTGLVSTDSLWLLPGFEVALAGVRPPESGLGGRLAVRTPPRGGCGKAFILMVFRIVLPAAFTACVVRNFGSVADSAVDGDTPALEGARMPLLGSGVWDPILVSSDVVVVPVLFRDFATGIGGNAVVGGPHDGREGRGRVVAMLKL
jgi:hypothetical protein